MLGATSGEGGRKAGVNGPEEVTQAVEGMEVESRLLTWRSPTIGRAIGHSPHRRLGEQGASDFQPMLVR